jgi:cysteine desulfurase
MDRIYFDYNATTPLASEVASVMRPYLDGEFGNPSSHHWAGERVRDAVERARQQVAGLLRCAPSEVVFTSGGTEANNTALVGTFFRRPVNSRPHFIVSSVEHPSIAATCGFLQRCGAVVTRLPVDRFGVVDPDDVRRAITPDTELVSVMHANNEVGTIQPVQSIAAIARAHGVLVHTDAAQSIGKVPVSVEELGVDLLSVAGHKTYASQGVGALVVRNGVLLEPWQHGAGHEGGRRAGTENVAAIAGLGKACEIAETWMRDTTIRQLRDYFWQSLSDRLGERVILNGHPQERLPNTLHVSFVGSDGEELLSRMPRLAASTGSACHAGNRQISPVLNAMGLPEQHSRGAIRFSLGRSSTRTEVDSVVDDLVNVLA